MISSTYDTNLNVRLRVIVLLCVKNRRRVSKQHMYKNHKNVRIHSSISFTTHVKRILTYRGQCLRQCTL